MDAVDVRYRYLTVAGTRIFYREAGPAGAPTLLLLHGLPSSSHQYRRLIALLGERYHVVAPDYPGSGYSDGLVDGAGIPQRYTFDRLAHVMEAFCAELGLTRFFLYAFDFGGPVGMRIALRQPRWIAGLIIQNANAYTAGLSDGAKALVQLRTGVEGARESAAAFLTLEGTRQQYLAGAARPERIAPESWTLDQHLLEQPGHKEAQIDLMLDYHTNVASYAAWQAWLRAHQPPTLILWGKNDPIFLEPGARAYLDDLRGAELHLFDTGHFALEEEAGAMAQAIDAFLARHHRG